MVSDGIALDIYTEGINHIFTPIGCKHSESTQLLSKFRICLLEICFQRLISRVHIYDAKFQTIDHYNMSYFS